MSSLKKCLIFLLFLSLSIALFAVFLQVRSQRGDSMSCIFCDIVNKKGDTELLYEDETYVAFRDIKPAASHHYLIIPKQHINDTKVLSIANKPMLLDMKRIMLELLAQNNQNNPDEISLGFHVPPFNSVKHLHLHGISKTSEMGLIGRWIFREDSYWYKKADTIIDSLPDTPSK